MKLSWEENCSKCTHNDDVRFCGSYCMYGDMFKEKKVIKDSDNKEGVKNVVK